MNWVFILHRLASVFRSNKPTLLPPLYEGESLACRVLDVNPSGVKFLQPVYLELPHFSALRDGERELVVLRTQDGGWNWQEVCVEDMKGTRMIYCCRFLEKASKIAANNEINEPETVAKSDTAIQPVAKYPSGAKRRKSCMTNARNICNIQNAGNTREYLHLSAGGKLGKMYHRRRPRLTCGLTMCGPIPVFKSIRYVYGICHFSILVSIF